MTANRSKFFKSQNVKTRDKNKKRKNFLYIYVGAFDERTDRETDGKGVRGILVRGVTAPLPPEAKKIFKI